MRANVNHQRGALVGACALLALVAVACANGAPAVEADRESTSTTAVAPDSLLVQWIFEPTDAERQDILSALRKKFGERLLVGELYRFADASDGRRYLLIQIRGEGDGESIVLWSIQAAADTGDLEVGEGFDAAVVGDAFAGSRIADLDGDGAMDAAYCVWPSGQVEEEGERRVVGLREGAWYRITNPEPAPPPCGTFGI